LEIDPADLFRHTTEKVQYWLNATLAACAAGEQAMELSAGKMSSWKEITSNEQYSHVPPAEVPTEVNGQSASPPHAATNSHARALGTDAKITKKIKHGHVAAALTTPGKKFEVGTAGEAGTTASHKRSNHSAHGRQRP